MISDREINCRAFTRRTIDPLTKDILYKVIVDGQCVLKTASRMKAYHRTNDERERISVEEALYDADLKINPVKLRRQQLKAKNLVKVVNPTFADFPICWRVFWGDKLIGAYLSQWEAEQYAKRVILDGGY